MAASGVFSSCETESKSVFWSFCDWPRHLRRAALFQRALLVHEERELRGKSVEQLALFDGRRSDDTDSEHAFGAIAGHKRKMQRVGIGKRVGRFPGGLLFLKSPGRDALVFARGRERAGRMLRKAAFVAQQHGGIGLKDILDQGQSFGQRFIEIATGGERAGQPIERGGAFFATAFRLFALAQLGGEMTDDERDDEIGAEHHEVVQLADVKGEARRNEEEVPEHRAESGEKERRPPAQTRGGKNDGEQIEERDRPIAGVVDDAPGHTAVTPAAMASAIPKSRHGARARRSSSVFRFFAADSSDGIMWMSMLPLWRMSQRRASRFHQVVQREPIDLPITIWVTLCCRAMRRSVSAMS